MSLNEVQLRNITCKWSSKSMTTPKVQNLWNILNESYPPIKFFEYSTRTVVKWPSINFCLNSVKKVESFIESGRRSHNLGAREKRLSEP